MREQRKLAAVLSADVVGYSRLMGRDEAGTLARLKEHRSERLEPVLARNGGRLVKLTGDGALAEFPSAVDALRAAIEFQQAVHEANAAKPHEQHVVFRVGLHLGDLIVDGDDLYGDGVNVAARLEGEAAPGGIVVSGALHEATAGKLQAEFVDLGRLSLKNIERQVQAYRVEWSRHRQQPAAPASPAALALPDKPSIAVLPFQNMSGDPEQEYFADGISEDIITELTRFRSLFVIARNSSFSYKGKSPDIRDVGSQLGVRYVLEGSIRKAGNRIRLSGQLIDAQTGSHIWAERYDRLLDDVFAVQEELTRSIVAAIAPNISEAELGRVRRRKTENLGAYEFAVRANATAWDAFARSDPKMCDEALRLVAAALAIDPDSMVALAARARAQLQHVARGTALDRDAAWQDGMAAVDRMLELDRLSSTAHVWKGMFLLFSPGEDRNDDALASARYGHELNPHDMTSLWCLAFTETMTGSPERSIELTQEALRRSPRDPLRPHLGQQLTMATFHAGRYAESVEHARNTIAEAPGLPALHAFLAASHVALGRYDEAKTAFAAAVKAGPEYIERILSGTLTGRAPRPGSRLRGNLRVAAGLDDPGTVENLR
jgi:adenylate cyclase